MRFSRLIFLLLFLTSAVWAGAADHYQLARVVLRGSKRYSEADLLRACGLKVGSQVTAADLQNAAGLLNGAGVFLSVQYLYKPAIGTNNGVEADFDLTDAPQFLPAVFDNFLWFSNEELQTALHNDLPLYNGELPLSGGLPDQVSASLTKMLAAKKLPSEVSWILESERGKPPREFLYKIENAGLKVSSFSFSGIVRLDAKLVNPAVTPLKGSDFFHSITDPWVKSKLTSIYLQNGYLKASVEVQPRLGEGGAVTMDVTINEGVQYRVSGFSWTGNTLISGEELTKHLTLKPGDPANGVRMENDLGAVRRMFGKFGREAAHIHPVMDFSEDSVRYTLEVTEGPVYHMGKVEILAPDQFKQKITGFWKLQEGAVYDSTYLAVVMEQVRQLLPAAARLEWKLREQIDDTAKIVNIQLDVAMKQQ